MGPGQCPGLSFLAPFGARPTHVAPWVRRSVGPVGPLVPGACMCLPSGYGNDVYAVSISFGEESHVAGMAFALVGQVQTISPRVMTSEPCNSVDE